MAAFLRVIKPFMKRGQGLRVLRAPHNKARDGGLNHLMVFNKPSPQSFLSPSLRLFTSSINGTVAISPGEQAWNNITDSLKPDLKQMIIDNDKEAFKRVAGPHVKDDAFDVDLAFAYGRRTFVEQPESRFVFPSTTLSETEVNNKCNELWDVLFMKFAENYELRKKHLSEAFNIDYDEIESLLPPNCKTGNKKAINFHLRGLNTFIGSTNDLKEHIGTDSQCVTGIGGATGCGKTSTILSLAHNNTAKQCQYYVIYTTCNGVIPDRNYEHLSNDIEANTFQYAPANWHHHPMETIQSNAKTDFRIAQYFVNCDVLSRILLLKTLYNADTSSITPHKHQQYQFSEEGEEFIVSMYQYLKQFSYDGINQLLRENLQFIKTKLDASTLLAVDEAHAAVFGFSYLLSNSVINTGFKALYDRVAGSNLGAGTKQIDEYYIRGILANYYYSVQHYLPFVAIGSLLNPTHLRFAGSGQDTAAQTLRLKYIHHFNVLSMNEVLDHIQQYPSFEKDMDWIRKYMQDSAFWQFSRPRAIELVLFHHYAEGGPILDALEMAEAEMKTVTEIGKNNLSEIETKDLLNVITNTVNMSRSPFEPSTEIISADYPSERHVSSMHIGTELYRQLTKCGMPAMRIRGSNRFYIQEPELVDTLSEELSKRLESKISGIYDGEKILSIDGGGSAGIIPIRLLRYIEQRLDDGKTIKNVFDRIVGVSAGGMISMGIMCGFSMDELTEMFCDIVSDTLPDSRFEQFIEYILIPDSVQFRTEQLAEICSKYIVPKLGGNSNNLNISLTELFPPRKSETPKLIIPAVMETRNRGKVQPFYFSNYGTNLDENTVLNAIIGTSAIIGLFEKANIKENEVQISSYFRDGGYLCNNPVLHAFGSSYIDNQENAASFLLSLGCGKDRNEQINIWKQIPLIMAGANSLSGRLNTNTVFAHTVMQKILTNNDTLQRYFRLSPSIEIGAVDGITNVKNKISEIDEKIEKEFSNELDHIIKTLNV